jgi:L-rhamnose-H+ transport protein
VSDCDESNCPRFPRRARRFSGTRERRAAAASQLLSPRARRQAWYFQFFYYTMGESQMGAYAFSSWTLHMASIIIFGTLWGFAFKEWVQSRRTTKQLVWTGVLALVIATVVIGAGNYSSSNQTRH